MTLVAASISACGIGGEMRRRLTEESRYEVIKLIQHATEVYFWRHGDQNSLEQTANASEATSRRKNVTVAGQKHSLV
jgi:hypothetical protein